MSTGEREELQGGWGTTEVLSWETSGLRVPCGQECCCEETSYVSTRVPAVSCTLLLTDTVKLPGWILISFLTSRNKLVIKNEHSLHIWSAFLCLFSLGGDLGFHCGNWYFTSSEAFPISYQISQTHSVLLRTCLERSPLHTFFKSILVFTQQQNMSDRMENSKRIQKVY